MAGPVANSQSGDPPLDAQEFLEAPTRDLGRWRLLWDSDHTFPPRTHRRGFKGRLILQVKKLLRPLVRAATADLWERQRVFNLIVVEYLEQLTANLELTRHDLLRDLREVRGDLLRDVQNNHGRISHLEAFKREGFGDVMRHSDALYAIVDQKLEDYRGEIRRLAGELTSLLARVGSSRSEDSADLVKALEDLSYRQLEDRFRGTSEEIRERAGLYLPYLRQRGRVLDLGCGRGEMLAVLRDQGYDPVGIDLNGEMVAACREQGFEAEVADLFTALERVSEGSLVGVTALHVIEHLPAPEIERLIRLAWRALKPEGVLILETPNPLSMIVAASNFWRDPTHRRPIHPQTLSFQAQQAGYSAVECLWLRPFPASERLPEVDATNLDPDLLPIAEGVNQLRDRLDALLLGYQDYAVIAYR